MTVSERVTTEFHTIQQNAILIDGELNALEKLSKNTPEYKEKQGVVHKNLIEILEKLKMLHQDHFEVSVEEIHPDAYVKTITDLFKKFHRL